MKLSFLSTVLVTACTVQATSLIDCYRFLSSRFQDFDGGAVLDGLVSPSDIRRMS